MDDEIGSGDDLTDDETPSQKGVVDVSDSPIARSERHKPVEQEEELAALLLAKNAYALADMVPFYEECDYPFFERVLQANRKV